MFHFSSSFRTWFEKQMALQRRAPDASRLPRSAGNRGNALLIDGDAVTMWFLGGDGWVYSFDMDRVAARLDREEDAAVAARILRRASEHDARLGELLEGIQPRTTRT